MPRLAEALYGKDNVPLLKVEKDEATGIHKVTQMTVCCLLEGEIDESYTEADNSPIIATDSIKNTIYIKSRENPVTPPEQFAALLGQHFLGTYQHISVAHVDIVIKRWTRMIIDGKEHPHSFYCDGNDKRKVKARITRQGIELETGITDLEVLKSTGSMFYGFVRDEWTTLPETWDRILATSVDASWKWKTLPNLAAVKEKTDMFNKAFDDARNITLKLFAEENSPSVQATMYKMGEKILEAAPETESVTYSLPNKHYFENDLSWHKGIKNTGKDAEVYVPQFGPNGLIKCTVARG